MGRLQYDEASAYSAGTTGTGLYSAIGNLLYKENNHDDSRTFESMTTNSHKLSSSAPQNYHRKNKKTTHGTRTRRPPHHNARISVNSSASDSYSDRDSQPSHKSKSTRSSKKSFNSYSDFSLGRFVSPESSLFSQDLQSSYTPNLPTIRSYNVEEDAAAIYAADILDRGGSFETAVKTVTSALKAENKENNLGTRSFCTAVTEENMYDDLDLAEYWASTSIFAVSSVYEAGGDKSMANAAASALLASARVSMEEGKSIQVATQIAASEASGAILLAGGSQELASIVAVAIIDNSKGYIPRSRHEKVNHTERKLNEANQERVNAMTELRQLVDMLRTSRESGDKQTEATIIHKLAETKDKKDRIENVIHSIKSSSDLFQTESQSGSSEKKTETTATTATTTTAESTEATETADTETTEESTEAETKDTEDSSEVSLTPSERKREREIEYENRKMRMELLNKFFEGTCFVAEELTKASMVCLKFGFETGYTCADMLCTEMVNLKDNGGCIPDVKFDFADLADRAGRPTNVLDEITLDSTTMSGQSNSTPSTLTGRGAATALQERRPNSIAPMNEQPNAIQPPIPASVLGPAGPIGTRPISAPISVVNGGGGQSVSVANAMNEMYSNRNNHNMLRNQRLMNIRAPQYATGSSVISYNTNLARQPANISNLMSDVDNILATSRTEGMRFSLPSTRYYSEAVAKNKYGLDSRDDSNTLGRTSDGPKSILKAPKFQSDTKGQTLTTIQEKLAEIDSNILGKASTTKPVQDTSNPKPSSISSSYDKNSIPGVHKISSPSTSLSNNTLNIGGNNGRGSSSLKNPKLYSSRPGKKSSSVKVKMPSTNVLSRLHGKK